MSKLIVLVTLLRCGNAAICPFTGHSTSCLQLTLFLLGNRTPPIKIAEWYTKRGMLKDKSARDQVTDLIKQHLHGKLEEQGRSTWIMNATVDKPVFDRKRPWDGVGEPAEDKNQVIATPSFAYDWEHQWMWTDAMDMLQNTKRRKIDLKSVFDKHSSRILS